MSDDVAAAAITAVAATPPPRGDMPLAATLSTDSTFC